MQKLSSTNFVLVCAAIAGFAGLLFLPLWVNQVIVEYSISDAGGGYLAAAEFTAVAISALYVSARLHRLSGKRSITLGFAALAFGNLLPVVSATLPLLVAGRIVAGLGAGVVLAYVHAAAAFTARPDRLYTIINFSIIVVGVAAYSAFVRLLLPWGSTAIFLLMCALALICFAPAALAKAAIWTRGDDRLVPAKGIEASCRGAVLGVLAFYIAEGTLWAYLIRLGAVAGVSTADAGYLLSTTLALGLLGALLADAAAKRIGRALPLGMTLVCLSVVAWALGDGSSSLQYSAAVVTLNFAFVIAVICTSGLLAEFDPSGRLAAQIPMLRTIGNAAGPWIGALILEFSGYKTLGWFVAITYIGSAVLLYAPARRLDRHGLLAATRV